MKAKHVDSAANLPASWLLVAERVVLRPVIQLDPQVAGAMIALNFRTLDAFESKELQGRRHIVFERQLDTSAFNPWQDALYAAAAFAQVVAWSDRLPTHYTQ